jgi:hypothetical protein
MEDMKYHESDRGTPQGGKCKALHFPPYAKLINMQSKTRKALKNPQYQQIYFAYSVKKKLKAKKQNVKEWLKENIHSKPSDTIERLNKKLVGHYRYYGISGNYEGLLKFYRYIRTALYKTLTRRSQRTYLTWRRYRMLLEKHPIAKPRIYVNIWQAV